MSTSDEPRRLRKGELKTILETHPGVVRKLRKSVPCTGFVTHDFSFKKQREGRLSTCKKPAYWTWRGLKGWRYHGPGEVPIEHFCWTHLMYQGVWGGMEEEARTWRWLRRLGYKTPTNL